MLTEELIWSPTDLGPRDWLEKSDSDEPKSYLSVSATEICMMMIFHRVSKEQFIVRVPVVTG